MFHEVIIVGAGAAGGRVLTDYDFTSYPVELGAEFIHGDKVSTHKLCEQFSISTKQIIRMPNLFYTSDTSKPAKFYKDIPQEEQYIIELACDIEKKLLNFELLEDESLANFLRRFSTDEKVYKAADILLSQTCCNSIENLSCFDIKEYLTVHDEHEGESKLLDGYTKLMNGLSKDLNILLNMAVKLIEWNDNGATIHVREEGTDKLHYFTCKKCIISVPVSILQTSIKFSPELPKFKQEAIHSFEFHPGTKLMYHFDKLLWDERITYLCQLGTTGRWWSQSHGFKTDYATICCYITHDRARFIDELDEEKALEFGLSDLSKLVGVEEETMKKHLIKCRRYSWAKEKYTKGAYSTMKVGKINARKDLLEPVGCLLFCGEACSINSNPQTVHGAIDSGFNIENYFK